MSMRGKTPDNDLTLQGSTILIVDDNPTNLGTVGDYLKECGFEIMVARSGERALKRARFAQPDLILLDVKMPGIDGFETCRRLKTDESTQAIPVIFMTVLTEIADKVKGFEVGGVDYVSKPVQHQEVLARVTTHLRIRNLTRGFRKQTAALQEEIAERKRVEETLQKYRYHLEELVEARTTELMQTNEQLQQGVTERKRAEEYLKRTYHKLRDTQAQLIQSAKLASIGELAAGVAHELNQPLMVIRTNAQFVRRTLEKGKMNTEQLLTLFEPLERNTKRMMNIIDHLRTFSRQSQGEFSPQQINTIIENSFLMVGEQLRLRNIAVQKRLTPDIPQVRGDANQLEQVFLNLLTNARDAIEAKGGKEPGNIDIVTHVCDDDQKFVKILVKDSGTGIAADHLQKILDPFFTTKKIGEGTGLGLSISYGIIKAHQGELDVLETGPEGTTFRIQLPVLTEN